MSRFIFLISFTFLGFASFSQNEIKGKASIIIVNEQNAVTEGTTLELLRSKDSVTIKTAVSDKNGLAEFENIK